MELPTVVEGVRRHYGYAKAWVKQADGKVGIYVPVQYVGPTANQANIDRYEAAVKKYWNGTFGKYTVDVQFLRGGWATKGGFTFATVVYMADAGGKRSWYYSGNGLMAINTESPYDATPAHEFGHLMGTKDYYVEATGLPVEGWEKNIMGSRTGMVEEINIVNAIARWGEASRDWNPPTP